MDTVLQSKGPMTVHETNIRSVAKCLTWRTTAFIDTVVLSLVFTGSITRALAIGGIEILTKTFLYYFHERAWVFISGWRDRRREPGDISFAHARRTSVYKALSWRIVGSIDTFFIALVITHDLAASGAIGIAEIFTKVVLYYLHERAWSRTRWGTDEQPARTEAPFSWIPFLR